MLYKLEFICHKKDISFYEEALGDNHLTFSSYEVYKFNDEWRNEVLFDFVPNLQVISFIFKEVALKNGLEEPYLSLSLVPEVDWLAENRKSFPPLSIGEFYIYGSHHDAAPPQDKIAFLIDAATAFGTGSHATTQGCLLALQDLKKQQFMPTIALDLGCGTGILAMAMARLFKISILASDCDPEAVEKSKRNSCENDLSTMVTCHLSEGFEAKVLKEKAPYDLITANILADPLISLASQIDAYMAQQGIAILSGLLATQAESVSNAYEALSFKEVARYPIEEWMTLVLEKVR